MHHQWHASSTGAMIVDVLLYRSSSGRPTPLQAGGRGVRMLRGYMLFVVADLAEIGGLCQESAESWLCFICNVAVRKKACRRGVFSSARG